jgi:bifunctional ADP-heptose synthase (sugar kinase/adenylyltransferase)
VPAVIRKAIEPDAGRRLAVVVDPKFSNFFAYRGGTVFKPNCSELEVALGAAVDVNHLGAICATPQRKGVQRTLPMLSGRTMALVSANSQISRVPTVAREVYDAMGTGDAITGHLASVLAAARSASEAAG